MGLSTPIFTLIVTALLGGIGWLVKWIFDRRSKDAEIEKSVAVAENTRALTEDLNTKRLLEAIEWRDKEISRLLDDKKVDQKAKLDLIDINKELIAANELLRKEVNELKKEVEQLRLSLVEAHIIKQPARTKKENK